MKIKTAARPDAAALSTDRSSLPQGNIPAEEAIMEPPNSIKKRGFTLVELLVVITIMLVLAGFLVPVAQKMRLKAQNAQCLSNLRQWGVVFNTYIYENNGKFPASEPQVGSNKVSWQHATAPLSQSIASADIKGWRAGKGILGCPAHGHGPSGTSGYNQQYFSYVYNYNLGIIPISVFTVNKQAKVIVLADASNTLGDNAGFSGLYGQEKRIGFVHGGKYNALYADWHVGSSDTLDIAENIIP
ncbi:MAG: type II secretion system protein [Phycisphaerae bacterium]